MQKNGIFQLLYGLVTIFLSSGCSSFAPEKHIGQAIWQATDRNVSDEVFLISPNAWGYYRDSVPQNIYLMDLTGKVLKSWAVDFEIVHNRLGPNGLLYIMKSPKKSERIFNWPGFSNEIIGIDNNSREKFSLKVEGMTHDFTFTDDQNIAVLQTKKVKWSLASNEKPNKVDLVFHVDQITLVGLQGNLIWEWSPAEFIKANNLAKGMTNGGYTGGNSIQYVPNNPITNRPAFLVSYRNIHAVLMVEYPSGKVIWRSPLGETNFQHDATFVDNSKVSVFNNNLVPASEMPNMQIIEWDLNNNKRSFFWEPPGRSVMTSVIMGGVRRLNNGSFLVSNSVSGHIFEIDPKGTLKWSYLFFPENKQNKTPYFILGSSFYRTEVYSQREVTRLRTLK